MPQHSLRSLIHTMIVLLCTGATVSIEGQPIRVEVAHLPCAPLEGNTPAFATVEGNLPDTSIRLFFRRLNEVVEDFYWVPMIPVGQGRYWTVLPKTEDRPLTTDGLSRMTEEEAERVSWARWWRMKEGSQHRNPQDSLDGNMIREKAGIGREIERHWLHDMSDIALQKWLEGLENEPVELYVSVVDVNGFELARSATRVTEVRRNCVAELTPHQAGEAENIKVGETASWQSQEKAFHWLCDGIVTRIDPQRIPRGDKLCRGCIVAWWKRREILAPVAVGIAAAGIFSVLDSEERPPVSPSLP